MQIIVWEAGQLASQARFSMGTGLHTGPTPLHSALCLGMNSPQIFGKWLRKHKQFPAANNSTPALQQIGSAVPKPCPLCRPAAAPHVDNSQQELHPLLQSPWRSAELGLLSALSSAPVARVPWLLAAQAYTALRQSSVLQPHQMDATKSALATSNQPELVHGNALCTGECW